MRTLESHSHLLFLASEKSRIEDDYMLEGSFSPKPLCLAFRKNMESLLEMLLAQLHSFDSLRPQGFALATARELI
jgi:hypothetical protein